MPVLSDIDATSTVDPSCSVFGSVIRNSKISGSSKIRFSQVRLPSRLSTDGLQITDSEVVGGKVVCSTVKGCAVERSDVSLAVLDACTVSHFTIFGLGGI